MDQTTAKALKEARQTSFENNKVIGAYAERVNNLAKENDGGIMDLADLAGENDEAITDLADYVGYLEQRIEALENK